MPIDPRQPLEPPPGHVRARKGLRVAGVTLICVGLAALGFGLTELVIAMNNTGRFSHEPKVGRIFLTMPGLLLVGIGGQMCLVGWAGSIARYGVREGAPAAAEGVNRVGMGAAPGISAIAAAVGDGLRAGVRCASCGSGQEADAKFCDGCGAAMARACPSCGETGGAGARFCDQCGAGMAGG